MNNNLLDSEVLPVMKDSYNTESEEILNQILDEVYSMSTSALAKSRAENIWNMIKSVGKTIITFEWLDELDNSERTKEITIIGKWFFLGFLTDNPFHIIKSEDIAKDYLKRVLETENYILNEVPVKAIFRIKLNTLDFTVGPELVIM